MRGYWFLLLTLETISATRRPPLHHCIICENLFPASSITVQVICIQPEIICLPPSHPTHRFFHYERYISLLRQVKYSCDTSSFTLSRGLVLPFWSLTLISSPSHRPSTFELCDLRVSLSRTHSTSKLCRWLGGSVQRIQHSLFYTVINSHIMYTFIFLLLKVFISSICWPNMFTKFPQ